MKPFLALAGFSLAVAMLLPSCGSTPGSAVPQGDSGEVSADLSLAKVPVLSSTWLEKNWGAPRVEVDREGHYHLMYRQGTSLNFVHIYGMTRGEPVPAKPKDWEEQYDNGYTLAIRYNKQSWRTMSILGKSVKWYQNDGGSGADFPCYKTVDFELTDPNGRKGFYRIESCAISAKDAASWMRRVNW
ncbi:MAG: hypothetical protein QM627_08485 [Luteolibacter sp.]